MGATSWSAKCRR